MDLPEIIRESTGWVSSTTRANGYVQLALARPAAATAKCSEE